jgi:hypothetical protein
MSVTRTVRVPIEELHALGVTTIRTDVTSEPRQLLKG